jgi:ubiquinone/menaquinone biosynthesis C-methylase UbiE
MTGNYPKSYNDRQARELSYHRERAARLAAEFLDRPVSLDPVTSTRRRWWNPHWRLYTLLRQWPLTGKTALVVGCGYGDDAIQLSRFGLDVYASDLSPDSLAIAAARASKFAKRSIDFQQMAAEKLTYPDNTFDLILVSDVFHHVDIPETLRELRRVAKPGCILLSLEMYTHSWLQRIRQSRFIKRYLHPAMTRWIYGFPVDQLYITEDERKLTEKDVGLIGNSLASMHADWFYVIVDRLIPNRITSVAVFDRMVMKLLGPAGSILGGRVVFWGPFAK